MLETGFTTTLAKRLEVTDTTITLAAVPLSVTKGIMLLGEKDKKEWISFTGVSGLTLTGVTRGLDKNASSITDNAGGDQPALVHVAGTAVRLVASHLDLVDADGDNTISGNNDLSGITTVSGTLNVTGVGDVVQFANTTARDAAITTPTDGMLCVVAGDLQHYNGTTVQWETAGATTPLPNASETAAGKVELATVAEQGISTSVGGTGARLIPANDNLVKTSSGAGDENKMAVLDSAGKFASGFIPDITPPGSLVMWCTGTPPTGWLIADASAVSRTTYAALFAVIGTTFGAGDGSTTFNLPDFRGRIPVGVGTGDATDATAHALADKEGTETHTLVTAELAAHNHSYTLAQAQSIATAGSPGNPGSKVQTVSSSTGSVGSGSAHNNLQPSLTVHYIIKV